METKRCLHCGTSMPAKRGTKKYCSPRCRYLAFIDKLRNGNRYIPKNTNGIEESKPNNNNRESIHSKEYLEIPEPNELKVYIREVLEEFLLQNPLSLTFGNITVSYAPNANNAINGKSDRSDNSFESKKELASIPFADESENPDTEKQSTLDDEPDYNVEHDESRLYDFNTIQTLSENANSETYGETPNGRDSERENASGIPENSFANRFKELFAKEIINKGLETVSGHSPKTQTQSISNANSIDYSIAVKEYEKTNVKNEENNCIGWIESRFLTLLTDEYNDTYSYSESQWNNSTHIRSVRWVSTRFLSLLRNTFKLTLSRTVHISAIRVLSGAFKKLTESSNFQRLPSDYWYKQEIFSLSRTLSHIAERYYKREKIPITFSPQRKVKIICLIIAMTERLPYIKFSELTFD